MSLMDRRAHEVGAALWRAQFGRALDVLSLEQMGRLQSLLVKMGWAERDEPFASLMKALDETEQAELLAFHALLDSAKRISLS